MKIGKLSESVLKRSVLRQLKTKNKEVLRGAGVGNDCAIFACPDGGSMVSCVQEGILPICPEKEAGSGPRTKADSAEIAEKLFPETVTVTRLIQKCVNNLVVSGAEPVAAMISLLLPEETEEPRIKALMAEAEKACREYAMEIAGGQSRVTRAIAAPVAVVTGFGKLASDRKAFTAKEAKAGQEIVLSKWIGLEGTAMLATANGDGLLTRYPAYLVEEAADFDRYLSVLPEAATAIKSGVCAMHDASEGGIFAALWELAEGAGVGLTIDLKKIPLRQETVEVCEYCNVNPYELKSGGCLVMTCCDGEALVEALAEEGIPAAVIGRLTDSNDRVVINDDEVRYMDRPRTDEIYKRKGE